MLSLGRYVHKVVEFPNVEGPLEFGYDEEWLGILQQTHQLMSLNRKQSPLPGKLPCPYNARLWYTEVGCLILKRTQTMVPGPRPHKPTALSVIKAPPPPALYSRNNNFLHYMLVIPCIAS